jgi:hypothetical protein
VSQVHLVTNAAHHLGVLERVTHLDMHRSTGTAQDSPWIDSPAVLELSLCTPTPDPHSRNTSCTSPADTICACHAVPNESLYWLPRWVMLSFV